MGVVISCDGRFEWDDEKNRKNIEKHGVSFAEVLEVFDDLNLLFRYDARHSCEEDRFFGIGCMRELLVITVCFTERKSRTRIISARKADKDEEVLYYEQCEKFNA